MNRRQASSFRCLRTVIVQPPDFFCVSHHDCCLHISVLPLLPSSNLPAKPFPAEICQGNCLGGKELTSPSICKGGMVLGGQGPSQFRLFNIAFPWLQQPCVDLGSNKAVWKERGVAENVSCPVGPEVERAGIEPGSLRRPFNKSDP